MEKYAIDIDKVLDEFEENEALKTDNKTIQCINTDDLMEDDDLSTLRTFPGDFGIVETLPSSQVCTKSECDIQLKTDSSLTLQNKDLVNPKDCSAIPYPPIEDLEDDILENNSYINACNSNEDKSHYANGCDSKHLNFNIFYKPKDSEHFNKNITVIDDPSNIRSIVYDEDDCNYEDEVLCVSVQEISCDSEGIADIQSEKNRHLHCSNSNLEQESEVIESLSELPENSNQTDFESFDSQPELLKSTLEYVNVLSNDKIYEYSKGSCNASNQNDCRNSTEINKVEKLPLNFHKGDSEQDIEQNSMSKDVIPECTSSLNSDVSSKKEMDLELNVARENSILKLTETKYVSKTNICETDMIDNVESFPTSSIKGISFPPDSVLECSERELLKTSGCVSHIETCALNQIDEIKSFCDDSLKSEYLSSSNINQNSGIDSVKVEDIIDSLKVEDIIDSLKVEDIIDSLKVEDIIDSLKVEDIIDSLKVEDIVIDSLKVEDIIDSPKVEDIVIDSLKVEDIVIDSLKVEDIVIDSDVSKKNLNEIEASLSTNVKESLPFSASTESNSFAQIAEPWKVCASGNAFESRDSPNISQDDDSGVSSQEDISGNSPSELPDNRTSNPSSNEKYDSDKEVISNVGVLQECKDIENESHDMNSLDECASCEKNDQNTKPETSHFDSDLPNAEISEVSNSFSGARPKIDLSIVDNKKTFNEILECDNKNDEIQACSAVAVEEPTQDCEVVSNTNSESMNNGCDISETISQFATNDINSDFCMASQIEMQKEEDPSEDVAVSEIIEEVSNSISEVTKNDEHSICLQRPTSLNLPSLQIPISEDLHGVPELVVEENPIAVTTFEEQVSEDSSMKRQSQIGFVKPYWIPDGEAPNCMHCAMKFTVIRRRHHCRACGKVLCSRCCNQRAHLHYMNKEDRICRSCAEILSTNNLPAVHNEPVPLSPESQSSSSCGSSPNFPPSPQVPLTKPNSKTIWRPHPNNPDDYCSTIPPLQQMELSGQKPPPTVMVPTGVLKRGNKRRKEPKQVIFSDGIRPGGDLTDLTEPTEIIPAYRRIGRKRMEKLLCDDAKDAGSLSPSLRSQQKCSQKRFLVSDEEGALPPIMLQKNDDDDKTVDWKHVLQILQDEEQKAVKFILMKNVHILVKLTKLDCCYGKECWCFTSEGFCSVGQDEVMVLLESIPGETNIPRDIFKLFTHIYDNASKGTTIEDLGHVIFSEKILDSSDHRGFLFVRPSFQCLSKLTVPTTPYLVAILIHKWEVPWAKVFPLRLMLRMGAECRYYPCSLVSVRHRKPIFFEIGQTIMSVLADLRNYQFTLPVIPGLVVHMEEKKTCVNIPRNRYEKVMKVLKTNNVEHVLPLGSNFSTEADSHLVCMQKEEGDYQTQAINIENTVRKVTGASFIVFSGALKSSSGLSAKFSIVEDGLLIQIPQETMVALHVALRDMRDLTIECGRIGASEPEEIVIVQWTRDDKKFNIGVRSPIDGKSFEGVSSSRIHTSTDYAGENYLIRWTEIFFIESEENGNSIQNESVDPCRMAETVAQSCCMALTPYLDQLAESELTKIGLRVTLDTEKDKVGYDIGSRGKALPSPYMNALDSGLIPVILRLSSSTQNEKLSFELIFHILLK